MKTDKLQNFYESLADGTFLSEPFNLEVWASDLKKFPVARCLEDEFFQEITSFKSQIDPKLTLFDILRERGRVPQEADEVREKAALLLENLTEADIDSLLQGACNVAVRGLFNGEDRYHGASLNDSV